MCFSSFLLVCSLWNIAYAIGDDPLYKAIFLWEDMAQFTVVNPSDYLPEPAADVEEVFSCIEHHISGPDPMICPSVQNDWSSTLADDEGYISIPGGRCIALARGCCHTTVCAPADAIRIESVEATARMWNPLTMRCVLNGKGGIWMGEGGQMVVAMARPKDGCKKSHA